MMNIASLYATTILALHITQYPNNMFKERKETHASPSMKMRLALARLLRDIQSCQTEWTGRNSKIASKFMLMLYSATCVIVIPVVKIQLPL